MDKLDAYRTMVEDAFGKLALASADLDKSEMERAGLVMEAKNAKDRAAMLDKINRGLEEEIQRLDKQHENDLLALEAMKEKLKRKNEQIENLKEANKAAMIGIGRMHKKMDTLKRRHATYDACINALKKEMENNRGTIANGQIENQRLRENCNAMYKTIIKLRSAAKELLDIDVGGTNA